MGENRPGAAVCARRGLTPRSTGPATAGSVSPVCGAFGTFAHRAYAACLRGPVTSNVRHHMTAVIAPATPLSLFESLPKAVAAIVSISALGYFAGWKEATAYYSALGAPWAISMLAPQSLLQLSATTIIAVVLSAFLSLQILIDSKASLRRIDWFCGLVLLLSAICILGAQGQLGNISSNGAYALASVGATLCAVAAGVTLTQLHFTLQRQPEGTKLQSGHLWLVYWFVLPALFIAPDRLGNARARLDSDVALSRLPNVTLPQNVSQHRDWRFIHLSGDKALLLRWDAATKRSSKIVDAKDLEYVAGIVAAPE
jgi:hypothetical protein